MEDTTANTPQKLRNARACGSCRSSKSRCVFKSPDHKICQRCEQSGAQCIVRTKARPMRARAVRSPGGKPISPRVGDPEFSLTLPSVSAPNSIKDVRDIRDHHEQFFGDEKSELDSTGPDEGPSLIERRKLTLLEAQQLFVSFRNKSVFFPFVRVPSDATVPSMARDSPFLLLAILTAAATTDPPLRHQLDHEFRRILSTKLIVSGQKSLDFLQGILVYIAWYPLHSKPKNNQVFMYVNLAIGLAIDLGLEKDTPTIDGFRIVNTNGLVQDGEFTAAAKRAYLGAYYISAALSMGFQKSENLHLRNLMDDRGEALLREEGSHDVAALVSLQSLAEQIAIFHRSKDPSQNDPLNAEMNAQIFKSDLEALRSITPSAVWNLPHISLFAHFIDIHIYSHQLGFLRRPYRHHFKAVQAAASPAHLKSCLKATKAFFTYLLSIPEAQYVHFSAFQWSLLVQTVLVTSRLTFILATKLNWDADKTRAEVPLIMYLDALSYRFQSVTSTPSPGPGIPPRNPDMIYVFKLILGSVKKSYEKRVARIEVNPFFNCEEGRNGAGEEIGGGEVGGGYMFGAHGMGIVRGHCPVKDPSLNGLFDNDDSTYGNSWGNTLDSSGMEFDIGMMDMGGADVGLGSGSAGVSTGGTAGVYFDLWATMTGSWAHEEL